MANDLGAVLEVIWNALRKNKQRFEVLQGKPPASSRRFFHSIPPARGVEQGFAHLRIRLERNFGCAANFGNRIICEVDSQRAGGECLLYLRTPIQTLIPGRTKVSRQEITYTLVEVKSEAAIVPKAHIVRRQTRQIGQRIISGGKRIDRGVPGGYHLHPFGLYQYYDFCW